MHPPTSNIMIHAAIRHIYLYIYNLSSLSFCWPLPILIGALCTNQPVQSMPINATTSNRSSSFASKASVGWMIPWGKHLGKQSNIQRYPEHKILEDSFDSIVDGISKLKMSQAVCQASTGFAAKAESRMELSKISKRISMPWDFEVCLLLAPCARS